VSTKWGPEDGFINRKYVVGEINTKISDNCCVKTDSSST
jgi:hypothetical protein